MSFDSSSLTCSICVATVRVYDRMYSRRKGTIDSDSSATVRSSLTRMTNITTTLTTDVASGMRPLMTRFSIE